MQENSPIKLRILEYLDYKGISRYKFYQETGVSRGILDQSNGISEENLTKFLVYANNEINLEWLLYGLGEMFKHRTPVLKEPNIEYAQGKRNILLTPQIITVDSDSGDENIVYVPVKAAAGYLNGYADREYIETLPSFRLPNLPTKGTYRAFEVSGDSMYPTLENKEMVIGGWVEKIDHIRDDRVHIIVTKSEGVIIKRVLNRIEQYGYLIAKSDNPNNRNLYPPIEIYPDDILELWYGVWHGGFNFKSPSDLWVKQNNLESDVVEIFRRLKEAGI